jgi:hypothetical protein
MLVSTCWIQLWTAGILISAVLVPFGHPRFWVFVRANIAWPISVVLIIIWHVVTQILLQKYVTPGASIKHPFAWLFLYIFLSSVYCVVCPSFLILLLPLPGFFSLLFRAVRADACQNNCELQ